MDKYEEKIISDMLKDKNIGDILSAEQVQYLKNVTKMEEDGYGKYNNNVLFRYTDEDEIFLEGDISDNGTLIITYIL